MSLIIDAIRFALLLFMVFLIARVVLSIVMVYARDWRPKGVSLLATEMVFSVTDPPIKGLRKIIPPLTIGQVRLDLAFLVLFFGVSFLWQILAVWGS